MIPKLAKTLAASGRREFVDQSDRVLASTRLVKFYEMEYSIERVACVEARDRLRSFIEREGLMLNFPVEVRFTTPDDIPLSTGTGREGAYIAVHVFQKMEYERYFRGVEAIMDDYGGRPHWGKLHFQTAETPHRSTRSGTRSLPPGTASTPRAASQTTTPAGCSDGSWR